MKRLLITIVCVLFTFSMYAEGNSGTEDIFNFGAGARAMGMGRTFVGLGDDVSTIYWNPGGLYNIEQKSISLYYSMLFYDTLYGFLGYVHPTMDFGTFGIGLLTLYTGGIPAYDENSYQLNDFSSTKMKFLVSYAFMLPWLPISAGVTVKMNLSSINSQSATSFNVDLGFMYNLMKSDYEKRALNKALTLENELTIGLVIKNLFFKTGERLYLEEDEVNFELKFGASYLHWIYPYLSARALLDVQFFEERSLQISFGLEINMYKQFFFRTGYSLDSGLSFGAGAILEDWQLDYALVFRPLGATHNVSVSWKFGKSKVELAREREDEIRRRIKNNVDTERRKQENKFGKIIKGKDHTIKQKDDAIKKMGQKIQGIIKKSQKDLKDAENRIVNLRKRSDEKVEKYKRRLQDAIDKNEKEIKRLKAIRDKEMKSLRKRMKDTILQMEKKNLNRINDLTKNYQLRIKNISQTNQSERIRIKNQYEKDKRRLKVNEKLKSKDYAKAVEFFNKRRFKDALRYFRKVQGMDARYADVRQYIQKIIAENRDISSYSQRILRLYRKGVRHFLKKNYRQAIAVWQEMLKLDPYNKLALRNIEMAKRRLDFIKKYNK